MLQKAPEISKPVPEDEARRYRRTYVPRKLLSCESHMLIGKTMEADNSRRCTP